MENILSKRYTTITNPSFICSTLSTCSMACGRFFDLSIVLCTALEFSFALWFVICFVKDDLSLWVAVASSFGFLLGLTFICVIPPTAKLITVLHEYGHYRRINQVYKKQHGSSVKFDYMLRRKHNHCPLVNIYEGKTFHPALQVITDKLLIRDFAASGSSFVCKLSLIGVGISSAITRCFCLPFSKDASYLYISSSLFVGICCAISVVETFTFFGARGENSDFYISKFPCDFKYIVNRKDYCPEIKVNLLCSLITFFLLYIIVAFICCVCYSFLSN